MLVFSFFSIQMFCYTTNWFCITMFQRRYTHTRVPVSSSANIIKIITPRCEAGIYRFFLIICLELTFSWHISQMYFLVISVFFLLSFKCSSIEFLCWLKLLEIKFISAYLATATVNILYNRKAQDICRQFYHDITSSYSYFTRPAANLFCGLS